MLNKVQEVSNTTVTTPLIPLLGGGTNPQHELIQNSNTYNWSWREANKKYKKYMNFETGLTSLFLFGTICFTINIDEQRVLNDLAIKKSTQVFLTQKPVWLWATNSKKFKKGEV